MSNTLITFNEENIESILDSSNPEVVQHHKQIKNYIRDPARPKGKNISDKDFYSYTTRHNVCGPNNMVLGGNESWREKNPDDNSPGWGCMRCDQHGAIPTNQKKYNNYAKDHPDVTPLPALDDMTAMCSSEITTWFPKQYDQDLMRTTNANKETYKWHQVNTVLDTGEGNSDHIKIAAQWWKAKLTDEQLEIYIKSIDYPGDIEDMKKEVIRFTDPTPICPKENEYSSLSIEVRGLATPSCNRDGYLVDIIDDQFLPWRAQYGLKKKEDKYSELDYSIFNKDLGPPNAGFEICLNNIFTDDNIEDKEYIRKLKQKNWKTYNDNDYAFIIRKLQIFLDHSNDKRLMICMDKLYKDDNICKAGISDQMVKVAEVLFHIIGYDPNFTIKDEGDRMRLEQLIKRLGNYVPRVLDRIIEISDMYESQNCRGDVSHSTHILRTAYDKMFQAENPMVTFSNPFSSLLSKKETNDNEFNRATILSILGIAFLKYF